MDNANSKHPVAIHKPGKLRNALGYQYPFQLSPNVALKVAAPLIIENAIICGTDNLNYFSVYGESVLM